MRWSVSVPLLACAVACGPAAHAGEGDVLRVGRTGIMCVRLPCPHRGIYPPGAKTAEALRRSLLYADLDGKAGLPKLDGQAADLQAVRRAWKENACVEIRGRLDGEAGEKTLHVLRVDGFCR